MTATTYDGAWMASHLTVARGRPPKDFLANCPVCGSVDNLHVGPGSYRDGRVKVQCKGCSALLPDVLGALNADGKNGSGPSVRLTTSRDDERPVKQPADARRDPRGWLAAKTGASPAYLDALPVSFSGGWIRHEFPGLPVRKERQAGTKRRRWTPDGAHTPPIWPLSDAMPEEALFTEGETDCIALRFLLDADNVYAVTKGADTPPTTDQWRELARLGLRYAVIAFDADPPGRAGAAKAVEAALAAGIEVSSVTPPGYSTLTGAGKDWCEWIAAGGTADTFPLSSSDEPVRSAKDMLAAPPTAWRHPGYEAVGGVHMLYGRPKTGKSTLEYARAAAFERKDPFLAIPATSRATTFFMTEEGDETIREKVDAFGMRRAQFLTYSDAKARGWGFAESLAYAVRKCHQQRHERLTIDTLATWAEVRDLNDSKEMLDAINAVRVATRGLTVTFIYHSRKSAGEHGDAILGASGIFAALDIATEIERDETRRNIRTDSRYRQVPDPIAVEFDGTTFSVVGAPKVRFSNRSADDTKGIVLDRLREGLVTPTQMESEGVASLRRYQLAKYCRDLVKDGKAVSQRVPHSKEVAYAAP